MFKNVLYVGTAVIAILATGPAYAADANLVTNGNFSNPIGYTSDYVNCGIWWNQLDPTFAAEISRQRGPCSDNPSAMFANCVGNGTGSSLGDTNGF